MLSYTSWGFTDIHLLIYSEIILYLFQINTAQAEVEMAKLKLNLANYKTELCKIYNKFDKIYERRWENQFEKLTTRSDFIFCQIDFLFCQVKFYFRQIEFWLHHFHFRLCRIDLKRGILYSTIGYSIAFLAKNRIVIWESHIWRTHILFQRAKFERFHKFLSDWNLFKFE